MHHSTHDESSPLRGRGTSQNPANRFELICYERDPESDPNDEPTPQTHFFKDISRSIITSNDSPDLGFDFSVNPYRGCEHGCPYCYARPYHEYLGLSAGLDFETRIMVKEDAPELLRKELTSRKWQPRLLSLSGVTDPYQPIERKLELTRRCLQVLAEFRNPVGIVTKNHLVSRDRDILGELAQYRAAVVFISLTSLDGELIRVMEPRASQPQGRLTAIREISAAGIPVGVMTAPIIPGLNDHEIPALIEAAASAGAKYAGYSILRLPGAVAGIFEDWLTQHFPAKKEKVLNRIREIRGGKLNDPRFGTRMKGEGIWAEQIRALFQMACAKAGIERGGVKLSTESFRRPGLVQRELFD